MGPAEDPGRKNEPADSLAPSFSDVDERVTSTRLLPLLGRYVARLEQMSRLLGWTTGYGTEGENPACITATFLYFTFHDEYTWSERRCAFTRHLKN